MSGSPTHYSSVSEILFLIIIICSICVASQAQSVEWERIGALEQAVAVDFSTDTLYTRVLSSAATGSFALRPQEENFSQAFPKRVSFKALLFLGRDTLLVSTGAANVNIYRTTDWFSSAESKVVDSGFSAPIELPSGTLLAGTRGNADGNGSLALRSTDRGETWTFVGLGNNAGIGVYAMVVVPPSPERPAGRIVAAGFNGIAYSDDDAQTWTPSSIYGALGYAVDAAVRVAGTGRILALVQGNGQTGAVMASDDDGESWAVVGPSPGISHLSSRLIAASDGSVFLYEVYGDDDDRTGRPVWRTRDQGVTWENVGPVWSEWTAVPREVVLGPDGRLYAATYGKSPGGVPQPILGGVFRTTAPVYAVSEEDAPTPPTLVGLRAYPNPTGGPVTIELTQTTPGEVTISLLDTQGRVVQEIHRGGASDGQRWAVETAGLAPGAYVVRVVSASGAATAGLTVAR